MARTHRILQTLVDRGWLDLDHDLEPVRFAAHRIGEAVADREQLPLAVVEEAEERLDQVREALVEAPFVLGVVAVQAVDDPVEGLARVARERAMPMLATALGLSEGEKREVINFPLKKV